MPASDLINAFAAELKSIQESRPPLSKSKIQDVTKAALKAKAEYKHVVFSIERFLPKCRPEHKISIIYIIDSIIRAARHQLKEKDVFAKRFLSAFDKIMPMLLECQPMEQLRIVRTVNLWIANGLYTDEEMISFRELCATRGITTDSAEVERLVKGEKANMAMYKKSSAEKRRSSQHPKFVESTTPPGPPPLQPAVGNGNEAEEQREQLPYDDLSEEIPPSGISEKWFMRVMLAHNCDFGQSFSTDRALFKRAHDLMVERLQCDEEQRRSQHAGNLRKMLEFDYDDDDEEEDVEKKKKEEDEYQPMPLEERERICVMLLSDPQVREALHLMHIDRMEKFNQIARDAQMKNARAPPPPAPNVPPPPHPLHQSLAMPNLQNFAMPPPQLPPGFALPPGLQNMNNNGVPTNLLNPNLINPALLANLGQLPFPPNLLANGLEFNPQLLLGQNFGVPPPNIPPPPMALLQNQPRVQSPDEDLRNTEGIDSRQKRSRSRDRGGEQGRKKSRRSRSPKKSESEEQKKKRKMGFPAESIPDTLTVASRTLWFGRLPSSCTDKDLQDILRPFGATTNINLVPSKACAYVTMDNRKSAYEVIRWKQQKPLKMKEREVKLSFSLPPSITNEEDKASWDQDKGYFFVSWKRLVPIPSMSAYFEGTQIDTNTLPPILQGKINEFGRPAEAENAASDEAMEISSPNGHLADPTVPPFNSFTNVLGIQAPPGLPPQPIPTNQLFLQQQLNQMLMPPGMQGLLGMHPPGLPPHLQGIPGAGGHLPLLQPPPDQQFGGMPIPSIGAPPPRAPPPRHSFDNSNREPLGGGPPGGFRGGFRGGPRGGMDRGGFRGGRGGFHGDRGSFRNDNWNDRPPRDDFRGGGDRRPDFRPRDGGQPEFRRDGAGFGGPPPPRRDFQDRGPDRRDFGRRSPQRQPERRDNGGSGRRRESRWGSSDNPPAEFSRSEPTFPGNNSELAPPGVDLTQPPPMITPQSTQTPPSAAISCFEEAVVTSTTEQKSEPSQ